MTMQEIEFRAPTGAEIAGACQADEDVWPVRWTETAEGFAEMDDYLGDDGPGGADWETVQLGGSAVYRDTAGLQWLERHLIRAEAEEANAMARRDLGAALALDLSERLLAALQEAAPVDMDPDGPCADMLREAECLSRDCGDMARQLRQAWRRTIAAERAAGRGIPPPLLVACPNCDWQGPRSDCDDHASAIMSAPGPLPEAGCPKCGAPCSPQAEGGQANG
jgi:hypothetical protein